MTNTVLEDIHDSIFFEIITEMVYLPSDIKKSFEQLLGPINTKIVDIDRKVEDLEKKILTISADDRHLWMRRMHDLQEKRLRLLARTKVEVEIQKNTLQLWIEEIDDKIQIHR